jgi:Mg-chelatase subunit ChlD
MTTLFAFFGLWETALAVAAGAVSIPIIIHLLNRRRFRVVVWAAMQFLLNAQKQNTRKIRLEQLILLAMRILILLLIVLAMASVSPWAEKVWSYFWPDAAGFITTRTGRTHKIIVIDASMSMNLVDAGGQTAFEQARGLAARMVRDSSSGDGFSVVAMKGAPVWIVAEVSQDRSRVAAEIEQLQPTHGNASVPATLNMIAAKLADSSPRFSRREVYFFTDMQKTTWLAGRSSLTLKESAEPNKKDNAVKQGKDTGSTEDNSPLQAIKKMANTIFVDAGRGDVDNLAVTDLVLNDSLVTTGNLISISAMVQNFGQHSRTKARVALLVGKARETPGEPSLSLRVESQRSEDLGPGEAVRVNFEHRFSAPGLYAVQIRLLGDEAEQDALRGPDDLDPDNARTIIVPVRDTVPVMLVNGKPAADRFDQATEFARLALNPFQNNDIPAWAPLRPKLLSTAQFIDGAEGDLAHYDCVYLCDVPRLGQAELRRLEAHLRRGGGIVISAGDQLAENLQNYNRMLYQDGKGILPAKLVKKIQAPKEHHFILNGSEDSFRDPPLRAFAEDDDRVSLRTIRFRQYLQANPATDGMARTILSFMPEVDPLAKADLDRSLPLNDPAVLEWNPPLPESRDREKSKGFPVNYRGKVILLTSTLNMDWNSWPGSPSYGAFLQELTRVAVSGRLRERSYLVGKIIEEYPPGTDVDVDVQIAGPDPKEVHHRQARDKNIVEGKYTVRQMLTPPEQQRTETAGDVGVFHWARTDLSGIYLLTFGRNPTEMPVAVNVPVTSPDQRGSESDLTRLSREQMREVYEGWDFQVVRDPRNAKAATDRPEDVEVVRGRLGPVIAHYALLAVLVLLFVEVVLANVFGHYSAVAGAPAPAPGTAAPAILAIVASLIFATGAFILIHANKTGDFMGFLPDSWRGWFEAWQGIPPPATGEATHWDLEFHSYLRDPSSDFWLAAGIAFLGGLVVFWCLRAEAPFVRPGYKALIGTMRMFLILLTLIVLLPQLQMRFDRQGWPDVALIIDDSRSMGEPDFYRDEAIQEALAGYTEMIRERLRAALPERIKSLRDDTAREKNAGSAQAKLETERLARKIQALEGQLARVNSPNWRPTRLQLAQGILNQNDENWLDFLLNRRRMKVHIFHLDSNGRAVRLSDAGGPAGDLLLDDPQSVEHAKRAIAGLEAEGQESRLGTAVRQVLDFYRGSSLSAVIMLTDGVTTRDETLGQVAEYAAQKGVPLFFVGLGDDHPIRDLSLHDLRVDDSPYVNDNVLFQASLTGRGFKDLSVPVVLKYRDKDGKEIEVDRKQVRISNKGKDVDVKLMHRPTRAGQYLYIVEVEVPKVDRPDKAIAPTHTRLERTINVLDSKLIKVLYVESEPRYEFRFIKYLLERERPDEKKNRSVELKVVLLDADPEFAGEDKTALVDFPATRQELEQYDVIILGDCDPRHPRLGEKRLRMLADFVRGEDVQGKKSNKTGGGLLMIAGQRFNPHAYKNTPLADVLPIEITGNPVEKDEWLNSYRLQLTPIGRQSNIFRLSPDDGENQAIWNRLAPMYWWSTGYRTKPLAEVLAVHQSERGQLKTPGQDGRHPLAVVQFVGSGRCMFFGFDETWRWRFRENEIYHSRFWVQCMRYLSRTRITRTVLRLDRQTPYRVGEPIRVNVKFPDNAPLPGLGKPGAPSEVKVIVEYRPQVRPGEKSEPEIQALKLKKEASPTNFEGLFQRTREGKYHFWLSSPDVSKEDPNGQKPSADARVELPPGELDRLRMNQEELAQASQATRGRFYTLVNANRLLSELPYGARVSLNSSRPPFLLWNHATCFLLVLFLFTSEWILRKRKHLL